MLKSIWIPAFLFVTSTAALAAPADGPAIEQAIAGNTIQGEMAVSGRYTEFYAKDGQIHGQDYTGTWSIQDDSMCFQYGEEPASCWQVEIDGDQVTWIKDGQPDGSGTIVAGNPNSY